MLWLLLRLLLRHNPPLGALRPPSKAKTKVGMWVCWPKTLQNDRCVFSVNCTAATPRQTHVKTTMGLKFCI